MTSIDIMIKRHIHMICDVTEHILLSNSARKV